jgi:tetratricopeptide (TPR) repeat protein
MTTSSKEQQVVIKGSWEDLLNQAHRAAANQSDEAIVLYEKVRNGLQRFSAAQLAANDGRLHDLLEAAAANLHVYLTQRERYDEALDALVQLQAINEEEGRKAWQQRRAMVLAQAGRNAEALAELRDLATSPGAHLTDWGNLVMQSLRGKEFAQAAAIIDEATQWRTAQNEAEATTGTRLSAEDAAYLENLRCIVALAAGRYADGVTHFETAGRLDEYYRERPYLLYARLVFYNQLELALPWIQRDARHPIRASFWHGVVLKRQGKPEVARRQWEGVIRSITPQTDNEQFVELVLSFYYLGDQEGQGLNGVLRALQSGGVQSWVLLFLAGLGWMLRDSLNNARTNFTLAISRRKAQAEGTKLSAEVWQHCQDLLTAEQQAQIVDYFQTEP